MIFLQIPSHHGMEVLSPTVILPIDSLLVILEPGHTSDPRFAMRSYMALRTSLPPTAHIHLFLTGTWFMVPCVSHPTSQWAISTGPSVHIKQQSYICPGYIRRVRSGTWVMISQRAGGEGSLPSPEGGALWRQLSVCGFGTTHSPRRKNGGS